MLGLPGQRVTCVYFMGSGVKDYWASAHKKRFIISTSLKLLFYGRFLSCILGTSVEQLFLTGGISVSSELLQQGRLRASRRGLALLGLVRRGNISGDARQRSCTVAWVSPRALQAPRVVGKISWMLSSGSHRVGLPRFLSYVTRVFLKRKGKCGNTRPQSNAKGFPLGRGGGGLLWERQARQIVV